MSQESDRTATVPTVAARHGVATDRPFLLPAPVAVVGAARARLSLRPPLDTPGTRRNRLTERTHR
jgi:hypothetical protein